MPLINILSISQQVMLVYMLGLVYISRFCRFVGLFILGGTKMGWKGYESTIPVGMIFRKMYCQKCGNRLKKKKISYTYKKGDPNYSNRILGHSTIGMDKLQLSHYIYQCPTCGNETTYEDQCIIAKQQKEKKK